ncbi:MAG: Gfo/Idh/MocA family oxidoreductase [Chloroflexi bacterium]|nr:Gfo/Idh/MocA family oxidoreductase [Chloroflexota bacterium]
MDRVRWAVVGTSDFALDWIARGVTLGRNAELAAIVSRDEARGAAAAQRAGAPLHYTSIEAIDRERVDGVFLVLPNRQHAPYAIEAAQRGLHVIVEKPMAPTLAECSAMIDAARAAGVTLAVAQCMEWAPPVVKARELVAEGAIGIPISASISASWNIPPAGRWREDETTEEGGGPLLDAGVHAIDAIQRILGPVERVAALLDTRVHQYAAEDTSTTLLRFASGAHGVMHAHFNCNQNELDIIGSEGRITSTAWLGREFAGDLTLRSGTRLTSFGLPVVNVYVPQIEHVSDCILRGETPIISGERGMANMRVLWAAIRSARSGTLVQVADVA